MYHGVSTDVIFWFLIGYLFGAYILPLTRHLIAAADFRKRAGKALEPEYMKSRQLTRQYARGIAKGAVKMAKAQHARETMPLKLRIKKQCLTLWSLIRSPFVGLYLRMTHSKEVDQTTTEKQRVGGFQAKK